MKVAVVFRNNHLEAVFASLDEASAYRNNRDHEVGNSEAFSVREAKVYETAKERMLIDAKNKLTSGEFQALYNDILESEANKNTPATVSTPRIIGVGFNEQEMLRIRVHCGCGVRTSDHFHCWNCGCAMHSADSHWSVDTSMYVCHPRQCAEAFGLKVNTVE